MKKQIANIQDTTVTTKKRGKGKAAKKTDKENVAKKSTPKGKKTKEKKTKEKEADVYSPPVTESPVRVLTKSGFPTNDVYYF